MTELMALRRWVAEIGVIGRNLNQLKRYTLFRQSRCGHACGDRETSLFGHDQPLAGTTELLDSGRPWNLSVNEAKGSPVTRLRLTSSPWTSCI
jgi:hypothetical protein